MMYLLLIVGFILLIKGADMFVDGSSSIASLLKVPGVVIGLTIVALGTSAPEAAVSITAGFAGSNEIAISNIIGSNLFNFLSVVGVCAAIKAFDSDHDILKRDFPVSIALSILLFVLMLDGTISRIDGVLLVAILIIYIFCMVRSALKNRVEADEEIKVMSPLKSIIFCLIGVAAIIGGGQLVVDSATKIALAFGMSQTLVGLTIIAIGTSLPELVTSIVAAGKGQSGMALGNVVGSSIFNIVFILELAYEDLELHVTDTGKYHLLCLRVCLDCEAMVFISELCKAGDDLVFIALLGRYDGLGKTGLRELDLRKFYYARTVADSIVRIRVREL